MSCFTLGGGFRAAILRKRAATPRSDVRFGSKADICSAIAMSALPPKADVRTWPALNSLGRATERAAAVRAASKSCLSASAVNVKGCDQEPQDKGRDQDLVCPADNNAIRARCTTEGNDGPAKQ